MHLFLTSCIKELLVSPSKIPLFQASRSFSVLSVPRSSWPKSNLWVYNSPSLPPSSPAPSATISWNQSSIRLTAWTQISDFGLSSSLSFSFSCWILQNFSTSEMRRNSLGWEQGRPTLAVRWAHAQPEKPPILPPDPPQVAGMSSPPLPRPRIRAELRVNPHQVR